jgi:hypothetical protein
MGSAEKRPLIFAFSEKNTKRLMELERQYGTDEHDGCYQERVRY